MNFFVKFWNTLTGTTTDPLKPRASVGYQAGSSGRRAQGWNASRLGPNTLLVQNLEQLRARSRDAIRNSALARSACDKFESNVVGNGIQPHFLHPDPEVRKDLQAAWNKWVKKSDYQRQLNFYGQQSLVARELFEAGECFVKFHVDEQYGFQLQLIESEQCPVLQNAKNEYPTEQTTKAGIVFDRNDRRIGYQIYAQHPYDFISGSFVSMTEFLFIPTEDMLHVVRPLRAGQLRGEPQMTPVLTLLHDIEGYADSERMRKKIGAMFAGFIRKNLSDVDNMFPPTQYQNSDVTDPNAAGTPVTPDSGITLGELEPGTMQELLPGEDVTFPQIPESGDYTLFMTTELHKFAAGCGLTYEQLTGDLRGVNYSSIRAGMLEFRRSIEQFQRNIIVHQFCDPTLQRWMKEAVLSGELELPSDYFEDPTPYESVAWVTPGWAWVDPQKEMAAYQMAVRSGFTSRSIVLRETGYDPEVVDNQNAEDNKRADELGIVYDSNPTKVLIGKESQPQGTESPKPEDGEDGEE